MGSVNPERIAIAISEAQSVSSLLQTPRKPRACYVFAHGAGAGMNHPFMAALANGLVDRDVAVLRYQFPYLERGSKRPDSPQVAHAAVRAAVSAAAGRLPNVPLFAVGKSFGGRMTSQTQAEVPLPGIRGLVFVGFPLHPAGKPSSDRGTHLFDVRVPMLFLQGTRDDLAHLPLLQSLCSNLKSRTTLKLIPDADHSFHVPVKTGRKDADVLIELLDSISDWIEEVIVAPPKH